MRKQKWRREYDSKFDKRQTELNPDSPTFLKEKLIVTGTELAELHGNYSCPFCLYTDKIKEFLIEVDGKVDRRLGQCPECGFKMLIKTLTARMTPEEFARFVYDYPAPLFWEKCSFDKFNKRLHMLGWSSAFWTEYKKLRGNDVTET